jgi:hypothetical protein
MEENYQVIIDKKHFDRLNEQTNLSQKAAYDRAKEIWDKEGKVDLTIRLYLKSSRKDIEGYDEYRFDNYCYLSERGKFIIPKKMKERLADIIKANTDQLMEESFGRNLVHINKIICLERTYERLIKRYKVITITGWLLALLIVIMNAIL